MGLFGKKRELVFLLNLDGVFNPTSRLYEDKETIKHPWGYWQISQKNVEFLKHIANTYKCFWISSWGNESNYLNDALDIKSFKSLFDADIKHKTQEVVDKKSIVDNILKKYINVILIDTDYTDDRIKCVTINQKYGITEDDRKVILEYIRSAR